MLSASTQFASTFFACSFLATVCAAANTFDHPARPAHAPIHPGPEVLGDFATTVLQHLSGPARRPFAKVLATLVSPTRQPSLTISTKATRNVQCANGVCTPTSTYANLNVSDLTRLLADGNLTLGTNATAPDILINAPFSWDSANTLALEAIGDIVVNKPVSDAGSGPLNLEYDVNGGGGALSFGGKGSITFAGLSDPLTINGQSYILAADIRTLARYIGDNPSGNFALARNYNAANDGKYAQSPIPVTFAGNFEGLGNAVTGLHVKGKSQDPIGFFQQTAGTAFIGNFSVAGTTVLTDKGEEVGGVVGNNDGTLYQVSFNGTIELGFTEQACNYIVGGIAGENDGTISFSHATGTIHVDSGGCRRTWVGGLVGDNTATVDYSWAGVTLSMTDGQDSLDFVGGLIGYATSGSVDQSFAVGSVSEDGLNFNDNVGGLIGSQQSGPVTNVSASGAVTVVKGYTGGLIGEMDGSSVENAVATGEVSASGDCVCGGAIGDGQFVSDATSYGSITVGENSLLGGFIGDDYNAGDLSNDGWCTTSSGITDPSMGAGNIPNDPGITPFTC